MAYASKRGRRPAEYASKSAHVHIVNSTSVKQFLAGCTLPKRAEEVALAAGRLGTVAAATPNPIQHVVAIDGGYREVAVQVEFPSATIAFFQFGALMFRVKDLEQMAEQAFIEPADMAKLKEMQRFELTLPIRNVALTDAGTLTHSVRRAVYDFFRKRLDGGLDTLAWFVFQEYGPKVAQWSLASCPHCDGHSIPLWRDKMSKEYTFSCPQCNGEILLTDVFRLHEAVDDDLGAGGVMGYVTTTVEQMLLVSLIRMMLAKKAGILREVLFIKDGPLAFFGQTANMHKPMRALCTYLRDKHDLYLAGLEKSGAFVEHADEIAGKLEPGQYLMLDNEHIYKYIIPGEANPARPYGSTTYYGNKLIFKSRDSRIYVVTLPTREALATPAEADFHNLAVVLSNVEKLRCDMYDDALFPVALVNKLVSLADHPSAAILHHFAMESMAA